MVFLLPFFYLYSNGWSLGFIVRNHAVEVYIGIIALIFTGMGIWIALKLSKPKVETIVIEKEVFIEKRQILL